MTLILKVAAGIVLAVALINGCASSGHAATDEARLGWFLPVARAAWPASPCTGHETVSVRADERLAGAAPLFGTSQLLGLAEPSTCRAWLAAALSPVEFCTVLVHELGHLAGLEHNDTPGDVMNVDAGFISYRPCEVAVARARARGIARFRAAQRSRDDGRG